MLGFVKEKGMIKKEDIKIYQSKEEIETDYENYKQHWRYNAQEEKGEHESGLVLRKVFTTEGLKVEYQGRDELKTKMQNEGLQEKDIENYLRMLKNQFIVMNEKESIGVKDLTKEERKKLMEEADKANLELMRKYHKFSEEKLSKIEEELKNNRERFFKDEGR